MSGIKRRRDLSPETSRKSSRLNPGFSNPDDEDLDTILEKIREQEESEALAKRLQEEFDTPQAANVVDLTGDYDVVATDNAGIGPSTPEDDEAMARRLAREWEELDAAERPEKKGAEACKNRNEGSVAPISSKSLRTSQPTCGSTSSAPAPLMDPVSPEDDLSGHRDIFTRSRSCTKCGKSVASPRSLVVFSATIPPPTLLSLLHGVCAACGQSHCRGCFRALACPKNCKGKTCGVADCCAEVRAIGLFEALGGFDRQYIGERLNSSKGNKASGRRPKVATVGPGGTGYSTESRSNYSGSRRPKDGENSTQLEDQRAAEASKAVAARWDDVVLRAFETITCMLPAPYSDAAETYDLLPHPSIRSLISISYLPELIGSLLINDSVTDWVERSNVYNGMLRLLRRMADSELSVGVLIGERLKKRKSVGLEDWMWGDGPVEWEMKPDTKAIVRAPPLYDHFKKLTKQCEIFMAGASHLLEGGSGEVEDMTVKATSLCMDIISAQQDMQHALSVVMRGKTVVTNHSPKGKGKDRDGNIEMEKRYCTACEELAFKHVALSTDSSTGGLAYTSYHYAQEVQQTANSVRQPTKRLHLIKEISATSTSLPPGVWVRVDEVRNDVMKFMIAGPEGTPYAGGLFEFHCFLPLEYPNVSPKMNLCTTAGGRVRFNPNLYANGKVCLSLLGTWPGRPEEQWSSKSTLLQVLVSIQSMILVDAPFFNEPGFGKAKLEDHRSISYNKNVALQTVRWAMVDWMKEEHRNGIWADVIASHFSIRGHKIRECIRKWADDDPRLRSYQASSTSTAGTHLTNQPYSQPYSPAYSPMLSDVAIDPGKTRPSLQPRSQAVELQGQDLLEEFDRGYTLIETWL